MNTTVTFEAERIGEKFRGLVIDLSSFDVVRRTGFYATSEDAKAAAASMWRVMNNHVVSIAA